MALKDMKRSKTLQNADEKIGPSNPDGEDYHYGLNVSLGHEEMKKLGLKTPRVGDKVKIHAHGHVTSVSESHHAGDKKPNRRVELQLRKMEVGSESEGHVANPAADGAKSAMDDALGFTDAEMGSEDDGNGENPKKGKAKSKKK
jgi:hypothetical protein